MIYRREAALGILRGLWLSIDKDRRRLLEDMTDADMQRFIAMLPLPGPEPGEETRLLPDCKDHVQAMIYVGRGDDEFWGPAEEVSASPTTNDEASGFPWEGTVEIEESDSEPTSPYYLDRSFSSISLATSFSTTSAEEMSSVDRVQQLLELQLTHRAVEAAMERAYEFLDHTRHRLYKLFDSRHDKKRHTGPTGLRYVISTDDLDAISEDDVLHEATWGESFAWEIDETWTVAEAHSTNADGGDWEW